MYQKMKVIVVVTFLLSILTISASKAIAGSEKPFAIDGFKLKIVSVSLGESFSTGGFKFVPKGMGKDERVLTVKVEVLTGNPKIVAESEGEFDVWTTDSKERKNSVRTTTSKIIDVSWHFGVAKTASSFLLHFPNGVTIDLSPLLHGNPASPENRAGEWRGSTKCGEVTFIVDPSGKNISSIEFTELKSLRKSYSLKSHSGGWPIDDDGKFDIDTIKLLDNIIFYGKFNQESTHATGTWEMPSGCSSEWKATKGKLE